MVWQTSCHSNILCKLIRGWLATLGTLGTLARAQLYKVVRCYPVSVMCVAGIHHKSLLFPPTAHRLAPRVVMMVTGGFWLELSITYTFKSRRPHTHIPQGRAAFHKLLLDMSKSWGNMAYSIVVLPMAKAYATMFQSHRHSPVVS